MSKSHMVNVLEYAFTSSECVNLLTGVLLLMEVFGDPLVNEYLAEYTTELLRT